MVFVEKYTLKATKKSRWKELRKIVPEVFYVFLLFQRVSQQFLEIQKNKLSRRSYGTFKNHKFGIISTKLSTQRHSSIINVLIRSSKRKKRCQELPLRDWLQRHYNHQHGSCKYACVCSSNKVKKLDTLVVQSYIILHFFGSYQLQWQ